MQPIAQRARTLIAQRTQAAELTQPEFLLDAILDGLNGVVRASAAERGADETCVRQSDELAHLTAEVEQFTRVLAYDLHEPLRMLASYAELLSKRHAGLLGDEADALIAEAVEAVARIRELSAGVRAYSRADRDETFVPRDAAPAG